MFQDVEAAGAIAMPEPGWLASKVGGRRLRRLDPVDSGKRQGRKRRAHAGQHFTSGSQCVSRNIRCVVLNETIPVPNDLLTAALILAQPRSDYAVARRGRQPRRNRGGREPDDGCEESRQHSAQVLFASLIGTTIEFFDFYIYATAAVLVFPALFFPASDPATATLASLATFGIAFLARPIGSALFGHFGDRVGRKTTLVAALLTMGVSTVAIGAAADLRDDRPRRAAAARAVPLRPGPRPRRRVGRRGAAGDRERAARQARVVRHVPAARRADRLLLLRRRLPGALAMARPTSSSSRSAGASRFWRAPCWCSSASTCG